MPRPPASVQDALVNGGIPAAYTAGQLQWLVQRHTELTRHSPSGRDLWHGRWAYTCHDLISTILMHPQKR